ncbi:MAG: PQQ-dependent sugar dehydrogenase [Candidatus Nanopelagicales bacterium]
MRRQTRTGHGAGAAVLLSATLALTACSTSAPADPSPTSSSGAGTVTSSEPAATPTPSPSASTASPSPTATAVRSPRVAGVSVLARRLEVPWGVAFLPSGSALVAQRRSGLVVLVSPAGRETVVGRVPGVADQGEGGLLGLAVDPDDATRVYAYLTSTRGDNRVVLLRLSEGRLSLQRTLLTGIPSGRRHNGGRIVVGPDGRLWIGTGDAGDIARAQRRGDLGGKILRIGRDGSVPADNPFGTPVWSYGHRNVQGLAFDSAGRLWATEFGQDTYDELNLIRRGGDYGWPLVEGKGGDPRYVDPQVVWRTDDASPSGLAIVGDVAFVGALKGRRLWQVPLAGGRAGTPVAAFTGRFGRLRTVAAAPDGTLWVTTSNRDGRGSPTADDDRILRVTLR